MKKIKKKGKDIRVPLIVLWKEEEYILSCAVDYTYCGKMRNNNKALLLGKLKLMFILQDEIPRMDLYYRIVSLYINTLQERMSLNRERRNSKCCMRPRALNVSFTLNSTAKPSEQDIVVCRPQ